MTLLVWYYQADNSDQSSYKYQYRDNPYNNKMA